MVLANLRGILGRLIAAKESLFFESKQTHGGKNTQFLKFLVTSGSDVVFYLSLSHIFSLFTPQN